MIDLKLRDYVSKVIERFLDRKGGDRALIYYTKKFDGIEIKKSELRVKNSEIIGSKEKLEPEIRRSIDLAATNIRKYHAEEMKRLGHGWKITDKGTVLGQVFNAVEKAGIYVPGGRFSYPSTVLMTAIPAQAAGVKRIIMVTPAKNITPAVLYAASISGVDEIYRAGGAQAIAAIAYGTETIPAVDLIVGPGNKYVNEAKRQVFGLVGIDSLAGPSEVAILADSNAKAIFIAADLLAQKEHDPDAKTYFFTDSQKLYDEVKKKLPVGFVKGNDLAKCSIKEAIDSINKLAPEHVEIMVKNPQRIAKQITNAGAIFIGDYASAVIGDYWSGPSHALPTGFAARYSSGISAATFIKRTSYISYSKKKFRDSAGYIKILADNEGLEYHKKSIETREKE